MKEVTYEDWQKNPTPRIMWVWDNDETDKVQRKVVYMIKRQGCTKHPVRTAINNDIDYEDYMYMHCAEIKKQRRMTNKELSRWLRENPTRRWKYNSINYACYRFYFYTERCADKEVCEKIVIREGDGEWREPLVEE